jgi:hypothetical protein
MAHHSRDPFDGMSNELRQLFGDELGATGKHPQGKLTPKDEGEIQLAIGCEKNKVVLAFGKDVSWIGFDPDQARDIAEKLCEKASAIDGIETVVRRVRDIGNLLRKGDELRDTLDQTKGLTGDETLSTSRGNQNETT